MPEEIKPLPVSKVLQSPSFVDEPLDEKFKILDDVRKNNLTHMGMEYSSDAFTPEKYAAQVERQNYVVRQAKNNLIQQELQGKIEDYAAANDMSPDEARDSIMKFRDGDTPQINEGLAQIIDWSDEKYNQVNKSSKDAGFSGFNNIGLTTNSGTVFGDGRIFQSADGKTQAAVKFLTDENGQYGTPKTTMIPLPNTYQTTLTDLTKRKNELTHILDVAGSEPGTLSQAKSHEFTQGQRESAEKELEEVNDKLSRYTDGLRGKSEFFKDKLDEQIRNDDALRAHIPQGSSMVVRPLAEFILGAAENERRTMAGLNMASYLATGDKGDLDDARAWTKDADDISQSKEFYGMGQTRHTPGLMAATAILIAEEAPEMALEIGAGAGASLLVRPAVKAVVKAASRRAFAEQLADEGLKLIAKEAKDTLIENRVKRWGAKVGAMLGELPSAAADAASNLSNIFDKVDSLNAEATKLENSGNAEEAKKKREEAIKIEGDAGKAFMIHFGVSYGMEYLPLERVLRRNEKALDMTENVFAAAQREAKGQAADASLQAGKDRASAFRDAVSKWMDSRYGRKTTEMMVGGSTEAITEVLQSISDNLTAKEFYDSHRDLLDGVPEAAWGGLVLGATLNWVATRTDKAALDRVVKEQVSMNDASMKDTDAAVAGVKGKEINGTVADAPKNVVQKVGATYRIIDPDMPEDTGIQNIEFKTSEEAEAWAEHRWENHGVNKIRETISQTRKDDGSEYTAEDLDSVVTASQKMVNAVAKSNGYAKESVWKSLSKSVTFAETDPALSVLNDLSEDDVVNSLSSLKASFDTDPSGEDYRARFGEETDTVLQQYEAWKQLPEDQRGAPPVMSATLATAVKFVHDFKKRQADMAAKQAEVDELKAREAQRQADLRAMAAARGEENEPSDEENAISDEQHAQMRRESDEKVRAQEERDAALEVKRNPSKNLIEAHWLDDSSPVGDPTEPNKKYTPEQKKQIRREHWNRIKNLDPKEAARDIVEQKRQENELIPEPWWKSSLNGRLFDPNKRVYTNGKITPGYSPTSEKDAENFIEKKLAEQQQILGEEFGNESVIPQNLNQNAPAKPEQATPFEVWKSSVRRRFAPDAEPSEVELAETQRVQEVFGENAPVNPDGTLDVIGALEQLSEQEGPIGELAGLLSDVIPTLNLSDQKLRYRMSNELDTDGVTAPSASGDMTVGQAEKSTKVGTNASVVEFLHHMVTDTIGLLLDNYTASVGASISQRPAMQTEPPPGTRGLPFKPGNLSAENTPAGIEARVAYETAMPFAMVQRTDETAMPFAMVQRTDTGAVSSSQSGATMKQMFVFNELSEVLGGRPQNGLVQAVVDGNYSFGSKRPTRETKHNYYLQTSPDGRVIARARGDGNWPKLPFQKDDRAWKKYQFDTGWESRLARLYLREVMTSGMYDALFDPQEGLAGTKMTRSDYLSQYGPDAPNYNLTSFSRFVQGVLMDPVFAMRVSKARYGFPAINVKDMVFGDVLNNALGARTMVPDPIQRFTLSRTLSLGQQVEASKIPALSPYWGPQMAFGAPETAGGPGGVDSRRTPGPRVSQAAFPEGVAGSTRSPQTVGTARASAQNYALSYQGTRQDATGESPLGTGEGRTPDQIDPSEIALRTSPEMAADQFGRPTPLLTEGKGRGMYSKVARPGRVTGEDIGQLTEVDDMTEEEVDELQEILDEESSEFYNLVFEDVAEKEASEKKDSLEAVAPIVSRAIYELGLHSGLINETNLSKVLSEANLGDDISEENISSILKGLKPEDEGSGINHMDVVDLMIVNPNVTVDDFNKLLNYLRDRRTQVVAKESVAQRSVKGTRSALGSVQNAFEVTPQDNEISDKAIEELANKWIEYRVPAAITMLTKDTDPDNKEATEYRNADRKTQTRMYRAAVKAVTPVGMTRAQSTRLGSEPVPEGSADTDAFKQEQAPKRDVLVEEQKRFSKSQQKQVTKLVGAPIKGVPSSQVLAVTGEDPVNILLEHVRGLDPVRLSAAHDVIVALSEEFGFMTGDTLENSLGQIRLNPQDGASWLSAERVLYALRASRNPVAIVESMPSIMELKGVLWGLAQNPQLLADAHSLATAFTDSVATKYGEMGFQVKTKETEEGDPEPEKVAAEPGEEPEEGQVDENTSGFVAIEGPRPGPSNEFINRVSRFNSANKGGNSTRIFPVGVRPFIPYNNRRVAISENTRWSKLDNKSVLEVYTEVSEMNPDATTEDLNRLYKDIWRRALSGQQGLDALAEMKDYVMKHRLENGTDLPLVSPEVGEARTSSPAIAISDLLNNELAQSKNPFQLYSGRRGFMDTTTKMITILKDGDPTTFLHELVHWMRFMQGADGKSMFDAALGSNYDAFMGWVTEDGKITGATEIEERIALGMEKYLMEGNKKASFLKGESKKVKDAFQRLAQVFREVYDGLADFVQLDTRARKGYERIFHGASPAAAPGPRQNLSITQMETKRNKLVGEVTKKHAQQFYKTQPHTPEPFEDWYPAFAEEVQLRGERLSKFVKFLENEGYVGNEEASLLRWRPAALPGIATDDEVNDMMRAAQQSGANAPTKEGIKDALNQEAKAPRNLVPRTTTDDSTQYPGDPVTLVGGVGIPSELNQTGALRVAMRLKGRSFRRWWTANGNAPWSAFNALLERNGQKAMIERDMLKIMKEAEDAIEKAARSTGISNAQAARHAVNRDLNAFLIEQDPVEKHKLYTALPTTEIKKAALRMRQYVDGLSIYLTSTGVVRGPLASAINNKVGFYLHRSYQINSDPGWKENMLNGALKGVWEKAIDVIETTRGISRDEAYNVGHEIMSSMGFANKPDSSGISVDATILMSVSKQFADVQKAADAILGLKEDPLTNFTKTVEGMAQLVSQHEFINKILKDGQAKGYVRAKNDPITAQNRHLTESFFGDTTPVDPNLWTTNPALAHQKTAVAGYFTTPEISQWMTDVMQANMPTNAAHRIVNTLNGLFKTSNTVHNWVSGLRNVYSATIGVWAQGHTGKYLPKATSLVARDGANKTLSPADEALMKEFMEHNIAESATMAELRDLDKRGFNLDEANKALMGANSFWGAVFSTPVKYANKLNPFKTTTSGAPAAGGATAEAIYRTARGFKKYDSVRKKIYGGTDTVAKIAAYLEEKDRVQKMFPNMTPKEIKAEAARRTHMTMFSFDMLPKAVNEFRTGIAGLLWGPFVSFPYSMARTYINTMAIGYTDMMTGYRRGGVTDRQFLDGSKRLAALTAMAWGTRAAVVGINAALGWEEEDEIAARKLMAPWDQDGNILFLSARGGEFSYINLSSLLPYSYLTDAVSALVGGSAVKDPESVMDPVVNMMKQLVKPFAASQFFLDAVGNEAKNSNQQGKQIWIEGDTMSRNLARVSGAFFAPLMAGDARNLVRLGLNPGDIGRFVGAKLNKDMDGWAKAAYATGLKVSTINVERQFPFQVKEWIRQYKTSTAGFYQQSTSRDPISKDDLTNSLQFAVDRHKLITRAASMHMNTLMTRFGLTEDAILDAMDKTSVTDGFGKMNGLQKQAIWDGVWADPITISDQQYYSIENAAEAADQPERMVWLDDLMNEGLLDVKAGR